MLQRAMLQQLVAWKERPHHPLVLSGLRQTGKTFIVRAFGNECYENVVYLDLRSNRTAHDAFEGDFDVDRMVLSITAANGEARFVPNRTLLILDEVQDCPNARSSLKYWDIDGRYDVIATGSFLGVKGFRQPYPRGVPVGYEEHAVMRPLSFGEFLSNANMGADVVSYVRDSLSRHEVIDKAVHNALRSLYLQYLIVGGMPEAVNTFLMSHDLNAVRGTQQAILASIRDDFGRYKDTDGNDRTNETLKLRAEACLDSLPVQLSKEYKKFQYSLVDLKAHSTDKADGLQYLVDVGIALKSHNLREIAAPLEGARVSTEFKVFYADTGLLMSQLAPGTAAGVLKGDLGAYKGALEENMVASAFASVGSDLYYYRGRSGSPELDFVCSRAGVPTLIECKSTNGRMTSMKYVLAHPQKYGAHPAIKFADTNIGFGDGFVTYPHYALGFLEPEEIPQVEIETDFSALKPPPSWNEEMGSESKG